MTRPIIKREPVDLPALVGHASELWPTLIELANTKAPEWTLIGGQMVFLHAIENRVQPPRVSTDLDLLVNVRITTNGLRTFVDGLNQVGFELVGTSPEGIAHRYQRRSVSIDVLAPEGLGPRTDLTTTPPGRTIAVPGGTQALQRTELVPVVCGDCRGYVPRPSLLGAIVGKALAVDVDDAPDAQRQDLVLLLSLVTDPVEVQTHLTRADRKRLRTRAELTDSNHSAWRGLPTRAAANGHAAYLLLTSPIN